MNPHQKMALFNLIVIAVAFIGFFFLIPLVGPEKAQVSFMVLIFLAFGFVWLASARDRTLYDERDKIIDRKAKIVTLYIFCICFVVGSLYLSFFTGDSDIPRRLFSCFTRFVVFIPLAAYFLVILILYKSRNMKNAQKNRQGGSQ